MVGADDHLQAVFDSLKRIFVKRTDMKNMFKGITLISCIIISDTLLCSGWTGLESQGGATW